MKNPKITFKEPKDVEIEFVNPKLDNNTILGQVDNNVNFEWQLDDEGSFMINFYIKKTWYNRFKWWISTKLFLPGTYRWIK